MAAGGEGGYPYHLHLAQGRSRKYPYPQTPAGGGGGYPKSQISAERGYSDPHIPGGGGGYPNCQIQPGGIVGGYPDPHTLAGRGGEYPKTKIPAEVGRGYPDPHISPGGGGYPNPQISPGGIVGEYHDPQIPGGGYRYPQTHEEQMQVETYQNLASSLVVWLNSAMNWIVQNGVPTNLMEIQAMLRNIDRFRAEEIPTWYNKRMEICNIYDHLQNYGVILLISDEIAPRQINLLWNRLESVLLAQQVTLKREIDRLDGLRLLELIEEAAHHLEGRLDNLERVLRGERREHNAAKSTEGNQRSALDGELKEIENHIANLVNHLLMRGFSDVHPVHQRVLCIGRKAGHLRTVVDNNATLKPPPGPSENQVLMAAQCQQSSDGGKMVETSSALRHVQFYFQWILNKHALLEKAEYGNNMDMVRQALDQHEKDHEEIITLKTEVDKCVTDRKKLALEEQQPYEKCLSHVQKMYPVLCKLSHQRREWLVSLQEFLHKAAGEMVWIEEKQVLLYEFGQRLDEFSIPDEQMYKTLVQEITNRKSQIKSVEDQGCTMIIDEHPATETIEMYISKIESRWTWLKQLLNCLAKHVQDICAYHQFFHEVQSCEQWINQQTEIVNNCMKREKIPFKELEEMKIECHDLQNDLVKYEERVAFHSKTSHDIIPLKQRNHQVTSPVKVYSLCVSEHISLELNEECILQDISQKSFWVVTNSHREKVSVPSICMVIPPPNYEAIALADRLKTLLEQLKTLVKTYNRKLTENMVMSTIKFIKTWDLGKFQSLGPASWEVLVRYLNDEAAKLMAGAGHADQTMQLQLKKDLDECNSKVQKFLKKLSEEVCEERQPEKTKSTAANRGQSPQTDTNKPYVTKSDGAHPVKSLGPASISDIVTTLGSEMVNRERRLSAKMAKKMDSDDSSDDSQPNTYPNDLEDPKLDSIGEQINGLSSQEDQMSVSRKVDRTVAPTKDGAVVFPTRDGAVYPTKDGAVSPTADEAAAPTADEAVAPTKDGAVSPTTDEAVAPTTDEAVAPSTDEAVAPTADEAVAPTKDGAVAPTTDEAVAPTTDEAVTPTTDEAVAPTTDEAVTHTTDEAVSHTTDEAVAPTTDEAVTPTTDEAVAPTTDEAVTHTTDEADTTDGAVAPTTDEAVTHTTDGAVTPTTDEAVTHTTDEAVAPTTDEAVTHTTVAQKVACRSNHQVDGHTLTVTLFHPLPPKPCYQNRVLIQGVNNAITEELLRNFLETKTKAQVTEFLYGEEDGNVVVTLSDNIDIVQLRKIFQECSIQGVFLKAARVAISSCILVQNLLPSSSHDVILYYFENKRRSGGGDVERVEMKIEERYCLIYFEDPSVIDGVLGQSHNLDGVDFEIHLHHECLGRRSSRKKSDLYLRMSSPGNKDNATLEDENTDNQAKNKTSSSVSSNPENESDFVDVQEWQENDGNNCTLPLCIKYKRAPDKKIIKYMKNIPCSWNFHLYWNFYTKTEPGKQMLHEILNKYNCSVAVFAEDEDLFLFEITENIFEQESDVVQLIHVVLDSVHTCAQQFLYLDNILVDQRIQGDLLQVVRQRKELDIARFELMVQQDFDALCVICTEKDQSLVHHAVTEIIHIVKKCFENHEEIIDVDPKWQKVMKTFGYLQKLCEKYPSVTIISDKTKPAIMLKGPRDQSKPAADHFLELLRTASSEVQEQIFSPGCQFEIFTYPELYGYIDNITMELSIVWIPNQQTKKIHLFSKRSEKIKGVDKLIRGCVQERLYTLAKGQTVFSTKMFRSLEEFKKMHTGKIFFSSSHKGLLLTATDDIFESIDDAVQEIICKETELQISRVLEEAEADGTKTTIAERGQFPKQSNENVDQADTTEPILNKGNGSKNDKGEENENCTICMCPQFDPKSLSCGHSFCSDCMDQLLKHKPVCPVCGKIVGTLTGDQPEDGRISIQTSLLDLAGYKGYGSIVITYDFPAGKQGPNHPSPGTWYGSLVRTAYLPNTPEGKKLCKMLELAFHRKLVFTINQSQTTGKEGLTWNDIHHKTNPSPGKQFGYPDPEYLSRVKDQLAAKGITEADV